jgi:hypothetical protein
VAVRKVRSDPGRVDRLDLHRSKLRVGGCVVLVEPNRSGGGGVYVLCVHVVACFVLEAWHLMARVWIPVRTEPPRKRRTPALAGARPPLSEHEPANDSARRIMAAAVDAVLDGR